MRGDHQIRSPGNHRQLALIAAAARAADINETSLVKVILNEL